MNTKHADIVIVFVNDGLRYFKRVCYLARRRAYINEVYNLLIEPFVI